MLEGLACLPGNDEGLAGTLTELAREDAINMTARLDDSES